MSSGLCVRACACDCAVSVRILHEYFCIMFRVSLIMRDNGTSLVFYIRNGNENKNC